MCHLVLVSVYNLFCVLIQILTPLSENHLKLDDIGWFFNWAFISNGTDMVKGCSTIMKKFSVIPDTKNDLI